MDDSENTTTPPEHHDAGETAPDGPSADATDPAGGPAADGTGAAAPDSVPCRGRVLVIEDEPPVANYLSDALTAAGCHVVVAADGEAGLELFRAEHPDVVVCDLLLPKVNGFKVMEEIAAEAPATPIVASSGIYRAEKYRDEVPHARLFLQKPLDMDHVGQLLALVDEAVAARGAVEPAAPAEPVRRTRAREPWIPTSVLPLPRVLAILWKARRTGLLTQRSRTRDVVFMMEEGRLRFVRTNDETLRLDRVLLQLGHVSREALEQAQADLEGRAVPTRLGEVLVGRGLISREALQGAVQVQLRRVIAAAFAETDAETMFREEDELVPMGDIRIDSDLRAVMVAGCAASSDDERLLGHLPDPACPVRVTEALEEVKLPAADRRLLETLPADARLSDVMSRADLVGLRGRPLAFGLLCAGLLEVREGDTWRRSVSRRPARDVAAECPPAALLALAAGGATGVLRWRRGGVTGWLALRDGQLVQGGSSDARARLGERLRAAGCITTDQLREALEVQSRTPRKPLGAVLLETGALDDASLDHALRAQVVGAARELAACARWDEAWMSDGEPPEREPLETPCPLGDLVLDGLRCADATTLEEIVEAVAPSRPSIDPAGLAESGLAWSDSEDVLLRALSPATDAIRSALADRTDADVLRAFAMALCATPSAELVTAG